MKYAFAFCGPIGSGKSSVSKLFATTIDAGWNSFGSTVKEIAIERGLPTNREGLQSLGAQLVKEERSAFCRRVVAKATYGRGSTIVIDGLRHIDIAMELQSIINPQALACVYVDAPRALRMERVRARDGVSAEQLELLELHSTEVEVEARLRSFAGLIADNAGPVGECVDSIVRWAQAQGHGSLLL